MSRRPLVTLGARVLVTSAVVWITSTVIGPLVTWWTQTLAIAAVIVPVWLAVGWIVSVVRVALRRVGVPSHGGG